MTPLLIGITGAAGTGKSTVSHELVRLYGFTRLAFADPVKSMLQVFLASYGMTAYQINRHIDGDLKEEPCAALDGSSCRYALQTLGTEWGRQRLNPTLWLHHLGARVMSLPPVQRARVVVDDVRMDNEADYLIDTFGPGVEIWKVDPQGAPRRSPPSHASERGLIGPVNQVIRHDFTMPNLDAILAEQMQRLDIDKRGVWAS